MLISHFSFTSFYWLLFIKGVFSLRARFARAAQNSLRDFGSLAILMGISIPHALEPAHFSNVQSGSYLKIVAA